MITLQLDTKACMSQLLLTDTFAQYLFIEGDVTTFNQFHIDGYIHPEFYDTDELESLHCAHHYAIWEHVQQYFLQIIKGKRTPLQFRIILSLNTDAIATLIQREGLSLQTGEVQGLYLNLKYDGTVLQCITGTSFHTFKLDKTLEQVWDKEATKIINHLELIK